MSNRARRFWLDVHLWVGLLAGLLLAVVGISGSALVWHDGLDALLNPERQVADTAAPLLPASTYVASALAALGPEVRPTVLRMPEAAGDAVRVTAIVPTEEGRPRSLTAWLDPAEARVLDTADNRAALIGILHVLHGTLLVPQWSGRQIVGWSGVVLTVSVVTGLWLWWPRVGSFAKALRWRRNRKGSANLHHVLGAWLALPLLVVALTGVYISFPQTARALFGPNTPAGPRPVRQPAQPLATPALGIDAVVAAALAAQPDARLASLSFPTDLVPAWRAQLVLDGQETRSLRIDEPTGAVSVAPPATPNAADPTMRLMRQIHDGNGTGLLWQSLVFVSGLLPALFWVTGIMMWLRRRRARRGRQGMPAQREGARSHVLSS